MRPAVGGQQPRLWWRRSRVRCSDHRHITSSVPMGHMYRDSWPGLHLHGTQRNDRVDFPMSPSHSSEHPLYHSREFHVNVVHARIPFTCNPLEHCRWSKVRAAPPTLQSLHVRHSVAEQMKRAMWGPPPGIPPMVAPTAETRGPVPQPETLTAAIAAPPRPSSAWSVAGSAA